MLLNGPLGAGLSAIGTIDMDLYSFVQLGIGGIMTVLGGGRAAWQAVHGKPFTSELLGAIAGVVIIGAASWSGFSAQVTAAKEETKTAAQVASSGIGAVCLVIGGGWAAWKLVHGEKAISQIVCAIVGVCIASAARI